jgi:hypothetical protein
VVPLLPGFARRPRAIEDQQKIAPVNHMRWELTLPLTLSLSDFGIYFYLLARQRRTPNTRKQGDC